MTAICYPVSTYWLTLIGIGTDLSDIPLLLVQFTAVKTQHNIIIMFDCFAGNLVLFCIYEYCINICIDLGCRVCVYVIDLFFQSGIKGK